MSVRFGEPLDVVWGRLAWLRGELSRYSYRPGWRLSVEPEAEFGFVLLIGARVRDVYHPEREVTIGRKVPVPPFLGDRADGADDFGRWLARELLEMERHESREWLRRDGVVFDDPHAGGG